MHTVQLTKGATALIDDEDIESVEQFLWCLHSAGYAVRREKGKMIYLHRYIMKPEDDEYIDHINKNRTDCRRSNMRICTNQQNCAGKSRHKSGTSIYKGVCFYKNGWMARIKCNRVEHYLGRYQTEEDAALAYNEAATKLFGEYAVLNTLPTNE